MTTMNRFMRNNMVIPATILGLFLSLILFGIMYSVIKAGRGAMEAKVNLPTIDFVRLTRDSEPESLTRKKPPPPPPKMKVVAAAVQQEGLSGLEIPSLSLNADVGGTALGGTKAMFDGDIIPLQCPPISYPSDARRAGLNGWVRIEFIVGPDGSVRSAKAVEAQPRGVFEAAAVLAAQKCRFKPKMVDGAPVEQKGSRKFNFNLNQSAG